MSDPAVDRTPSPSGTDSTGGDRPLGGSGDLAQWQDTLAAEHAIIWSYGLVGATGDLAGPAATAIAVHRTRRATCISVVTDLGGEPVASAPAYEVAKPRSIPTARRLAADLERAGTVTYLALTASDDRATRLLAAQWLRESAVAQNRWAGDVPAMPGFETA